ncbi:hypothetical protein CPB86DRAFT_823671 [Serendipita vermifera]|nr:hypothetical protein CPB86DRAFT_823671 [Serendipita vermifera]
MKVIRSGSSRTLSLEQIILLPPGRVLRLKASFSTVGRIEEEESETFSPVSGGIGIRSLEGPIRTGCGHSSSPSVVGFSPRIRRVKYRISTSTSSPFPFIDVEIAATARYALVDLFLKELQELPIVDYYLKALSDEAKRCKDSLCSVTLKICIQLDGSVPRLTQFCVVRSNLLTNGALDVSGTSFVGYYPRFSNWSRALG